MSLGKFYFVAILLFLLFMSSGLLKSQSLVTDSIASAPEVTVYGNRLKEFDAGVKVLTSDSVAKNSFRHANLSVFLEENSSLYVKSYGLGSLSTTAFRGASASQTSVLWNGFTLQSPMNGTLDLALVPVSLVDQVKVQFGGCGALWGSGAVSGSIHLDNIPAYGKGWALRYGANYGNFKNLSQHASVSLSKKRVVVSVKGFFNEAKNNFTYVNTAQYGEPQQRQTNAALQQYGYLIDHSLKVSKRDQFSIRIWQQYSHREIPPTMLVNFSDAVQKDWFLRLSSEWQHSRRKSMYNLRAAYFDENLLYRELSKNIDAYSRSICQITEAEAKVKVIERGMVTVGINNTYSTAQVDAYLGLPYQNRTAVFSSVKYTGKKENWKLNAGARKELISGSRYAESWGVPLMPFAGADFRIQKKIVLKTNLSRNYRLPTFNDLYWTPGGNLNLEPEQGWSQEAGLHFSHQEKSCTGGNCVASGKKLAALSVSTTIFNRNIHNWIMWVPQGNYWRPLNIMEVWSRGIENTAELKLNFVNYRIFFGAGYDYVLSTAEKVAPGNENELHKQLIYVPPHKTTGHAGITLKGYGVRYTQHYTSWVFTQADNETFIDPYWLGNLVLTKTYAMGTKGMGINFLFKINNVWNSNYQVLAFRAMPGRNFEAGISLQYNQNN